MSGEKSPMAIDEYASLEEAVMAKPKGREFLREYARRHRVTGADDVLKGLGEFKELLAEQREPEQVGILRAELREMSASIAQTRRDIRAINPEEASDNRIMAATEELDAIVTAAERATTDILGHAEQLQEIGAKLRESGADAELCDAIAAHVTEVFLACSFQDITGQRTTKVVNILRYLEQRVNTMIEVWGRDESKDDQGSSIRTGAGAAPLDGPQLAGQGVNQDQVDEMLREVGEHEGPFEAAAAAAAGSTPLNGETENADLDSLFGPESEAAA